VRTLHEKHSGSQVPSSIVVPRILVPRVKGGSPVTSSRRYLGTWTLPSGNSANVYLGPDQVLACEWDVPPGPRWPPEDLAHYQAVTLPELLHAVAAVTGQRVLGVQL
jgi:hypothetical protein